MNGYSDDFDLLDLRVCNRCGSAVADQTKHDEWHVRVGSAVQAAYSAEARTAVIGSGGLLSRSSGRLPGD